MSSKRLKRRKNALKVLNDLFSQKHDAFVIHYSCESFYDTPDGQTPRITSIAVKSLMTEQNHSFSIHKTAELEGCLPSGIDKDYDRFEKGTLDDFFEFVRQNSGKRWIHWNMRDINYGFAAIEHRYRVLKGEPVIIPDSQKYNLSSILRDIYGSKYIGHPRLLKLIEKNDIRPRNFLPGDQEAKAFKDGDYVSLYRSTLSKADTLAYIAIKAYEGTLKTDAKSWSFFGGYLEWIADTIQNHPIVVILGFIVAILGFVISLL